MDFQSIALPAELSARQSLEREVYARGRGFQGRGQKRLRGVGLSEESGAALRSLETEALPRRGWYLLLVI